jgi:tetratricopeptide (TPR) repeat protein
MSSVSHIVRFWLFLGFLGAAAAQAPAPQQPAGKDLTPTRLPDIPTKPEPGGKNPAPSPLPDQPVVSNGAPRAYALIVGIAKYENLDASEFLHFSESDASAMYRALISKEGGAFPAENVHLLTGPKATRANLQYEIEKWLPSVATQSNDRVVVYFSGHGVVTNGHGYLAPWDVDPSNAQSVERTGFPMDVLGSVLSQKVAAKSKLLLLDACHAGKITSDTSDEAVIAQLHQLPKTLLTFTATRAAERSYEDPKLSTGFSIFTYFVIQGLMGNADNDPCDGIITADELIEYVRGEVRSYARARNVSQTPQDQGDVDYRKIILAAHPACISGLVTQGIPLGSLVVESNMDNVDVYLDETFVGKVDTKTPLLIPGLSTGSHTVKGVREGYEPDTKQELVIQGQRHTVTLRIQYRREYKRSAVQLLDNGEKVLFKPASLGRSLNPIAVYSPASQRKEELVHARELFTEALKEEPNYARAAYDLAQTCDLLSDENGMFEGFRSAIRSDPSYVDARVDYAGALIESGDPDEAIRQLLEAIRLDPKRDLAYSHLSRAYLDKGVFSNAVEAADKAIALNSDNHQAFLWKADALRRSAAREKDAALQRQTYSQAEDAYDSYVELTNFATPLYQKFAYLAGLGLGGARNRPDRPLNYAYQRCLAFMGLCECQDMLGNRRHAIESCEKAIHYDSNDPIAYFLLANVYSDLFNQTPRREFLVSARTNYLKMIQLNPNIEQSSHAKGYVEQIDQILPKLNK